RGYFVQIIAFVIDRMGPQQPASTPQVDGVQLHTIASGDVLGSEESRLQEPRATMLESVGGAQAYHAMSREWTPRRRPHAAFVQRVRNFGFGVRIEELVDLTDNGRVCRAQFDARLG